MPYGLTYGPLKDVCREMDTCQKNIDKLFGVVRHVSYLLVSLLHTLCDVKCKISVKEVIEGSATVVWALFLEVKGIN